MSNRTLICFFTFVAGAIGSGGKPPVPNPAGPAEIRVLNETQPAGGTVQLKFSLTEPKPILTGTSGVQAGADFFSAIDGIALFSDTGDVFGTALLHNGFLRISFASPNGTFGSSSDYPLFTVAAQIRPDAPKGSTINLALDPSSTFMNAIGQAIQFAPKPGAIKVGGSVSIANVIPGGGAWKAGTVIRVLGMGFQPKTAIRMDGPGISSVRVVSSNEIDLTLKDDAVLDGNPIFVTNPDGSTDTYYSYIRGVPQGQSNNLLLAQSVPVFSTLTHSQASIVQSSAGVVTGLAIQSPNSDAVQVQLEAFDPVGNRIAQASLALAFGERITRELGEYFGLTLAAGSTVRVTSSEPVQLLGMLADMNAWTVTPVSPVF